MQRVLSVESQEGQGGRQCNTCASSISVQLRQDMLQLMCAVFGRTKMIGCAVVWLFLRQALALQCGSWMLFRMRVQKAARVLVAKT